MSKHFERHQTDVFTKLNNFELYVKRQSLTRFLARYEIFKLASDVKGSIVECGVHHGGGLMAWAKLSAGLEPIALDRRVFGFDTFEGFTEINDKDKGGSQNASLEKGGFSAGKTSYDYILDCIKEYDENRFINQFPKVDLIKGDANLTIPVFVNENPHLIISILFLDFDLYEPTRTALKYLLPRVPRGGIVAFDEINNPAWPGETIALIEEYSGLNGISLKRFSFDPNISYMIL